MARMGAALVPPTMPPRRSKNGAGVCCEARAPYKTPKPSRQGDAGLLQGQCSLHTHCEGSRDEVRAPDPCAHAMGLTERPPFSVEKGWFAWERPLCRPPCHHLSFFLL